MPGACRSPPITSAPRSTVSAADASSGAMLRRLIAALIAAAAVLAAATPAAARRAVEVTITRTAPDQWVVDYAFDGRPGVWFFPRSSTDLDGKPWRPQA